MTVQYRRVSLTLHNRCLQACQGGGLTADEIAILTNVARGRSAATPATKPDYDAALALLARLEQRDGEPAEQNRGVDNSGERSLVDEAAVLKAALLWARNHIDVGVKPELQAAIVRRLDAVLVAHPPTFADMEMFRMIYPVTRHA